MMNDFYLMVEWLSIFVAFTKSLSDTCSLVFFQSFFALNLNLIGSHEICHDVDSISLILSKSFSGKLKVTSEKF